VHFVSIIITGHMELASANYTVLKGTSATEMRYAKDYKEPVGISGILLR